MKTLKEMNLGELKELYIEHREIYIKTGNEDFRNHALEVEKEYLSRTAKQEKQEVKTIKVFFEQGYKWSVDIEGEEESRFIGLNKVDAMKEAKEINKKEFNNKAIIEDQKLSKKEKAENIKYLHETTLTYSMK